MCNSEKKKKKEKTRIDLVVQFKKISAFTLTK